LVVESIRGSTITLSRRKYYNNGSHAGFILYNFELLSLIAEFAAMRKA